MLSTVLVYILIDINSIALKNQKTYEVSSFLLLENKLWIQIPTEYGSDLRSKKHQVTIMKIRPEKNLDLYKIWTHDLCDTLQRSTNLANQPTGS